MGRAHRKATNTAPLLLRCGCGVLAALLAALALDAQARDGGWDGARSVGRWSEASRIAQARRAEDLPARGRMSAEERQRLRRDMEAARRDYRSARERRAGEGRDAAQPLSPSERRRLREDVRDTDRALRRQR